MSIIIYRRLYYIDDDAMDRNCAQKSGVEKLYHPIAIKVAHPFVGVCNAITVIVLLLQSLLLLHCIS